jgi:hypothetical protein
MLWFWTTTLPPLHVRPAMNRRAIEQRPIYMGSHQWGLQACFSPIDRALFASPAIYRGAIYANHRIQQKATVL